MRLHRSLSLLILIALLSCGGDSNRYPTFWHAMGGPLGDVLQSIIDDFNKKVPGPPLIGVSMGNYATLSQKLMGASAAGKPPGMAQVYESWTSELLDAGKIVPIEDYLHGEGGIPDSVVEDILPVFREDNQWDGRFITFPFNKSVPVFFYNMDLFEERGIDHFPRTWEEFREVAKKLTFDRDGDGKIDVWGTAFPVSTWMFACILHQKGGALIKDGKATFDSPEGIAALQFLVDLVHKDSVAYITTGFRHQDDFAMGKVAMVWGTIVSFTFLKRTVKFRMGVAPLPHDKDSIVVISGTNVALFSGVPEEFRRRNFEFLKFFLRPENQIKWSVGTGYLPLRRKILDLPEMKEFYKELPGMEEAVKQVEHATFEPRTPAWFTGRRYLATEGLEPAMRGFATPEESLKRAAKLVNQELLRVKKAKHQA